MTPMQMTIQFCFLQRIALAVLTKKKRNLQHAHLVFWRSLRELWWRKIWRLKTPTKFSAFINHRHTGTSITKRPGRRNRWWAACSWRNRCKSWRRSSPSPYPRVAMLPKNISPQITTILIRIIIRSTGAIWWFEGPTNVKFWMGLRTDWLKTGGWPRYAPNKNVKRQKKLAYSRLRKKCTSSLKKRKKRFKRSWGGRSRTTRKSNLSIWSRKDWLASRCSKWRKLRNNWSRCRRKIYAWPNPSQSWRAAISVRRPPAALSANLPQSSRPRSCRSRLGTKRSRLLLNATSDRPSCKLKKKSNLRLSRMKRCSIKWTSLSTHRGRSTTNRCKCQQLLISSLPCPCKC